MSFTEEELKKELDKLFKKYENQNWFISIKVSGTSYLTGEESRHIIYNKLPIMEIFNFNDVIDDASREASFKYSIYNQSYTICLEDKSSKIIIDIYRVSKYKPIFKIHIFHDTKLF